MAFPAPAILSCSIRCHLPRAWAVMGFLHSASSGLHLTNPLPSSAAVFSWWGAHILLSAPTPPDSESSNLSPPSSKTRVTGCFPSEAFVIKMGEDLTSLSRTIVVLPSLAPACLTPRGSMAQPPDAGESLLTKP